MTSARNKKLIKAVGGHVMAFRDLPTPAQLGIAWYMAVDGEAWELPPEYHHAGASVQRLDQVFRSLLPWLRKTYGAKKIGYVEIPTEALTSTIMRDEDLAADPAKFKDFDEYHQWYLKGGRIPDHPTAGRWPVILSEFNEETLQDGWHRLHDYYRKGARIIPAVYYP